MTPMEFHNGGAEALSAYASYQTATAGGTGDATEANGAWTSRDSDAGRATSANLVIGYQATLAEDETLSIAANIQDASDSSGTGAADFGTAYASAVVATGPTGGGTVNGTIELDFDLDPADKYVRSQITPNLSASGTDTCKVFASWVFFGAAKQPMSASVI